MTALRLLTAVLAIVAVIKELRLPQEERTWHGALGGFVPYDLRMPTVERYKSTLWNLMAPPSSSTGCSALSGGSISEPSSPSHARYAVPTELEDGVDVAVAETRRVLDHRGPRGSAATL